MPATALNIYNNNTPALTANIPAASSHLLSANTLKGFIHEFNFADPKFTRLPQAFPHCDLTGLSKADRYLFEAIIIAYITSDKNGIRQVQKSALKAGLLTALIILLTLVFSNYSRSPGFAYVKEISAATVSATLRFSGIPENTSAKEILESQK